LAQRQRWIAKEAAEMPAVVLVLPILPDKEEVWRRFAQDLLGDRLGEYEDLARRLGIGGVRVYVAKVFRREAIVARVEANAPKEAFRRLAASEEPFDEWFRERLAELHGWDLGRWRAGSPPELVFEHPGDPGSP
jgi:hypothetical protein